MDSNSSNHRNEQKTTTIQQLPSVVLADEMNKYIDSYIGGSQNCTTSIPSSYAEHVPLLESTVKAEEELEVFLKETDEQQEIQNHVHFEDFDMTEKEERSRQRRAASARSKYQKMSEDERRVYNHRRRLRALGVTAANIQTNVEDVKDQMRQINEKKAEAARLRYHRMTAEQKRDYNMRRTEAFRRRRQEEEMLLSTPAGRISAETLAKAQQIMIRNQRKAESARLRYQRMTLEERKAYNIKRATAKRLRKLNTEAEKMDNFDEFSESTDVGVDMTEEHINVESLEESTQGIQSHGIETLEHEFHGSTDDHIRHTIDEVAQPQEIDIFKKMERDVIRRTRIAHATIQRLPNPTSIPISCSLHRDMPYHLAPTLPHDIPTTSSCPENGNSGGLLHTTLPNSLLEKTHVIDEKMLKSMVRTGVDLNGLPVDIRTVDGKQIRNLSDLISVSHGQTVLITQQNPDDVKTVHGESYTSVPHQLDMDALGPYTADEMNGVEDNDAEYDDFKEKRTRARRAERARARYHRMSLEQRREQNAKRALTLRKSRARDDQLCQLFENVPHDQIDEQTMSSIQEAKCRRARRAQQARSKYHKMNCEQRRQYNAQRDLQRKTRRAFHEEKHEMEEEDETTKALASLTSTDGDCSSYLPFEM